MAVDMSAAEATSLLDKQKAAARHTTRACSTSAIHCQTPSVPRGKVRHGQVCGWQESDGNTALPIDRRPDDCQP